MTQPIVRGSPIPRNYFYELLDYPLEWIALGVLIGIVIGVVVTLLMIRRKDKRREASE